MNNKRAFAASSLNIAVEYLTDACEALDAACLEPTLADRINAVPGQDQLTCILRELRSIALDEGERLTLQLTEA